MRRLLLGCIGLFFYTISDGQAKLFLGAEASYAADHYKIEDQPGGSLAKVPLDGFLFGLNLRLMVDNISFVELGLYKRSHWQGIGFSNGMYAKSSDPFSVLIPLRFGLSIPIWKEKLRVGPVAGYTFGIRNNNETAWAEGDFQQPGTDRVNFFYENNYRTRTYSLIQTGANIDIRVFKKAFIRLTASHYAGLQDILVQDMRYSVNNGVNIPAKQTYKGSFWSIGTGFILPLGDAAIKKE